MLLKEYPAMNNTQSIADYADTVAEAQLRQLIVGKNTFVVAHKEALGDVGEWAECMDTGAFVYIPQEDWQVLIDN